MRPSYRSQPTAANQCNIDRLAAISYPHLKQKPWGYETATKQLVVQLSCCVHRVHCVHVAFIAFMPRSAFTAFTAFCVLPAFSRSCCVHAFFAFLLRSAFTAFSAFTATRVQHTQRSCVTKDRTFIMPARHVLATRHYQTPSAPTAMSTAIRNTNQNTIFEVVINPCGI